MKLKLYVWKTRVVGWYWEVASADWTLREARGAEPPWSIIENGFGKTHQEAVAKGLAALDQAAVNS